MGDDVMFGNGSTRLRLVSVGAACCLALLVGCAAAGPPKVAGAPAPAARAAAPVAQAPTEVSTLVVREGAPGLQVDLQASGPLVWTSYRDAAGRLVIELPNTRPAPGVGDWSSPSGLLARLAVELDTSSDRPLTRLVAETRGEAEHSLTGEAGRLRLELTPVVTTPILAAEPLPQEPAPAAAQPVAVDESSAKAAALGTPENPLLGPAPSGAAATRLSAVEILPDPQGSVVRLEGDGEFAYSAFRLSSPDRFVIDLAGVVNATRKSQVPVGDGVLDRARVSQFKAQPQPVSRVVFDLHGPTPATIERTAQGLMVRFDHGQPSATASTLVEDLAAPQPTRQAPAPTQGAVVAETAPAPAPVAETPAAPPPAVVAEQAVATAPAPEPEPAAAVSRDGGSDVAEAVAPAPAPAFAVADAEPLPTAPLAAPPAPAPAPKLEPVELFEAADVPAPEQPAASVTRTEIQAFEPKTVGGQRKQYVGEPVSLSLKDADIRDVLRSFAQISGLNVVVQPGIRGTVTVELENVPWDQALDQILKINGLGYELDGNIMRIAPLQTLRNEAQENAQLATEQQKAIPLRTVLKRLSYSEAGDMARILRGGTGMMSQRGSIQTDLRTNTLIIKELPAYMDTVLAVIETLDIPEPQVMIEARIIETTKQFGRTLGVAWGFDGIADAAHGNTTGLIFPNNVDVKGSTNLLTGGNNGFLDITLGNVLDTFKLNAVLQAAENEGLINVLSAPRITTLNNVVAEIQSGLQIPIQTVANNTVTVQFVNATLRLSVVPHVTAEGTVMLTINVQKREPQQAFAVVGAPNAPIATKEATTTVVVRDGATTVIGGIYKVSTSQGEDRVPALSNIPFLGHLFKNKRRSDSNEELLIFITPRVVKL